MRVQMPLHPDRVWRRGGSIVTDVEPSDRDCPTVCTSALVSVELLVSLTASKQDSLIMTIVSQFRGFKGCLACPDLIKFLPSRLSRIWTIHAPFESCGWLMSLVCSRKLMSGHTKGSVGRKLIRE